MTLLSKWIMFISSYVPLFFIFTINSIFGYINNLNNTIEKKLSLKDGIVKFFQSFTVDFYHVSFCAFFLIIFFSFILLLIIIKLRGRDTSNKNINILKNNSTEISNYFLLYIIPFITINENIYGLIVFFLIFVILGKIYITSNSLHINPTIYCLKYNIYLASDDNSDNSKEFILITKKNKVDFFRDNQITVSKWSESIYFEC